MDDHRTRAGLRRGLACTLVLAAAAWAPGCALLDTALQARLDELASREADLTRKIEETYRTIKAGDIDLASGLATLADLNARYQRTKDEIAALRTQSDLPAWALWLMALGNIAGAGFLGNRWFRWKGVAVEVFRAIERAHRKGKQKAAKQEVARLNDPLIDTTTRELFPPQAETG